MLLMKGQLFQKQMKKGIITYVNEQFCYYLAILKKS